MKHDRRRRETSAAAGQAAGAVRIDPRSGAIEGHMDPTAVPRQERRGASRSSRIDSELNETSQVDHQTVPSAAAETPIERSSRSNRAQREVPLPAESLLLHDSTTDAEAIEQRQIRLRERQAREARENARLRRRARRQRRALRAIVDPNIYSHGGAISSTSGFTLQRLLAFESAWFITGAISLLVCFSADQKRRTASSAVAAAHCDQPLQDWVLVVCAVQLLLVVCNLAFILGWKRVQTGFRIRVPESEGDEEQGSGSSRNCNFQAFRWLWNRQRDAVSRESLLPDVGHGNRRERRHRHHQPTSSSSVRHISTRDPVESATLASDGLDSSVDVRTLRSQFRNVSRKFAAAFLVTRLLLLFWIIWGSLGAIWAFQAFRDPSCRLYMATQFPVIMIVSAVHVCIVILPLLVFVCCVPFAMLLLRRCPSWFEPGRRRRTPGANTSSIDRWTSTAVFGTSLTSAVSGEDAMCAICLAEYNDGDELSFLPCRHHFHKSCVYAWLMSNKSCPMCKAVIDAGGGPLDLNSRTGSQVTEDGGDGGDGTNGDGTNGGARENASHTHSRSTSEFESSSHVDPSDVSSALAL